MRTAAMIREHTGKTQAVLDLIGSRQLLAELAEIDRKIRKATDLLGFRQKPSQIESVEIDWRALTVRDLIGLAEIDQKILKAMNSNNSITQIEVDSREVSFRNFQVLLDLEYQVVSLPFQKIIISWKLVEAAVPVST